ncbi:uncharacterized PPE family protein PPE40-like [Pecten maximus]|uniref:uncharacterized PPE family protein PPE40-like n=1 Tax=Pecten maximus TaxID=6579 RepID=UPI001458488C|nr:uncharacterized PPE family protein PPE40-like [Pecten maximus]
MFVNSGQRPIGRGIAPINAGIGFQPFATIDDANQGRGGGGPMFVNSGQRPIGRGIAPINAGIGFQPIATIDDVNQGRGAGGPMFVNSGQPPIGRGIAPINAGIGFQPFATIDDVNQGRGAGGPMFVNSGQRPIGRGIAPINAGIGFQPFATIDDVNQGRGAGGPMFVNSGQRPIGRGIAPINAGIGFQPFATIDDVNQGRGGGGPMFVNSGQRPIGRGIAPINAGIGFQPIPTIDDVNQGQGPIIPFTNTFNANLDGSLDTPAVMPTIPAFNSVEGRFSAGLDFNDPRIRTQSAAVAASNIEEPRFNTNDLGQNQIPQNLDFDGIVAGPNIGFDQNLAVGPGFQGGVNFEPMIGIPGRGFQLGQPEQFPFDLREGGFNDNGFQGFTPGPQFTDFNDFQQPSNFQGVIGGFPQGDISPTPFDANVFPGLTFPNQPVNSFIPQIGGDFNIIGAGEPSNINGNDLIFPGGQIFT